MRTNYLGSLIGRILSIALMLFSILFCWTWGNGYNMGDAVLTSLGLKAWSGVSGLHGTHYTVLYSFVMLVLAAVSYALTTRKKVTTLLCWFGGFALLFLIVSIV